MVGKFNDGRDAQSFCTQAKVKLIFKINYYMCEKTGEHRSTGQGRSVDTSADVDQEYYDLCQLFQAD